VAQVSALMKDESSHVKQPDTATPTGPVLTDLNPGKCSSCGRDATERCKDDYCRECHVSCSWESCIDGTWANEIRAKAGLPPVRI